MWAVSSRGNFDRRAANFHMSLPSSEPPEPSAQRWRAASSRAVARRGSLAPAKLEALSSELGGAPFTVVDVADASTIGPAEGPGAGTSPASRIAWATSCSSPSSARPGRLLELLFAPRGRRGGGAEGGRGAAEGSGSVVLFSTVAVPGFHQPRRHLERERCRGGSDARARGRVRAKVRVNAIAPSISESAMAAPMLGRRRWRRRWRRRTAAAHRRGRRLRGARLLPAQRRRRLDHRPDHRRRRRAPRGGLSARFTVGCDLAVARRRGDSSAHHTKTCMALSLSRSLRSKPIARAGIRSMAQFAYKSNLPAGKRHFLHVDDCRRRVPRGD